LIGYVFSYYTFKFNIHSDYYVNDKKNSRSEYIMIILFGFLGVMCFLSFIYVYLINWDEIAYNRIITRLKKKRNDTTLKELRRKKLKRLKKIKLFR